jgi:hypothetical protein
MTELDISPMPAWPVILNLVVIFSCWLYYSNRSGWSDLPEGAGAVYRCDRCGHVYEGDRQQPRSACPRCGQFSDAVVR